MGLLELQQIRANRDKPKEKKKYQIPKKSAKRIAQEKYQKETAGPNTLNEWFDAVAKRHLMGGIGLCMECGAQIPAEYMRHATAHLLPKKLFKSIATNDLNYLILCAGNGCHDKTHRLDKFVTMKVWPLAASRISQLIALLPYDEMKYVSAQLYYELENT